MRPIHRLTSLPSSMTKLHREAVKSGERVLNTDLRLTAQTHSVLRSDKVCELLFHTQMLVNKNFINDRTTIALTGAWYQNQRGSTDDNTQAAHFIPGQPTFNGLSFGGLLVTAQKANQVIKEPNGLLATQINSTCGGTTIAPKILNKTDSFLEGLGLVRIFEGAVRAAATAGIISGGQFSQEQLLKIYEIHFKEPMLPLLTEAIEICDQAISAGLPDAEEKGQMREILEIYQGNIKSHEPDLSNKIPMESILDAWVEIEPCSEDISTGTDDSGVATTSTTTTDQIDNSNSGSSNNANE